MKPLRRNYAGAVTRKSDALKRLAVGLSEATSKIEQAYWEQQLVALIDKSFTPSGQEILQATLDRLWEQHPDAYEMLADVIEARTESSLLSVKGVQYQCLFFCAPLLVWSPLHIPTPLIPAQDLNEIMAQLHAHIFSRHARITLADRLLSPDQLPFGFNATHQWAQDLFKCALKGQPLHLESEELPDTAEFISDLRFLVGAVLVPIDQPLFRWQEDNCQQQDAFTNWSTQAHAVLAKHLPGCTAQLLLPGAFYSACRQADRTARPFFVLAGIAYLQTLTECKTDELSASIGPFHPPESRDLIAEYRIGLKHQNAEGIQHGVVWPIFTEEEQTSAAEEIRQVLTAAGITDIVMHTHHFPLEYCDDCGAPLFANRDGETVHTETPEQDEDTPHYLH